MCDVVTGELRMKYLVIILAVIAGLFFGWGYKTETNAKSPDERLGAIVPYLIAAGAAILDALFLIGWIISKLV